MYVSTLIIEKHRKYSQKLNINTIGFYNKMVYLKGN